MSLPRRALLGSGAAALALAGCASPPAQYYRLAVLPGAVHPGIARTIRIRAIGIPAYLDQNEIAEFSGTYQFATFPNSLWAEPLANMLQTTLVQELSQRLPDSQILGSGGAIGTPADTELELNLLRFDPDASGRIVLDAQLAVRGGAPRNLQSSLVPAGRKPVDIVAGMSVLWAGLADRVAKEAAAPGPG